MFLNKMEAEVFSETSASNYGTRRCYNT